MKKNEPSRYLAWKCIKEHKNWRKTILTYRPQSQLSKAILVLLQVAIRDKLRFIKE